MGFMHLATRAAGLVAILAVGIGVVGKTAPHLFMSVPNVGFILWAMTGLPREGSDFVGANMLGVAGTVAGVTLTTCFKSCKGFQRCRDSTRCAKLQHHHFALVWVALGCAGLAGGVATFGEKEDYSWSRSDVGFETFVFVPAVSAGILAMISVGLYALLELVTGCRSGKRTQRRCRRCRKEAADDDLLDHEQLQPQNKRSKRVMGAATVLGLVCGYTVMATLVVWPNVNGLWAWLTFMFLVGPMISLPFVLGFAAAAQMGLEVCAVEGSNSTSRWLAFTLTMLSFGERKRKGRKGKITRCFGNPNLSELHGMMCNCLYGLGKEGKRRRWNLLRWFVDKTMPFTFWSQGVS